MFANRDKDTQIKNPIIFSIMFGFDTISNPTPSKARNNINHTATFIIVNVFIFLKYNFYLATPPILSWW